MSIRYPVNDTRIRLLPCPLCESEKIQVQVRPHAPHKHLAQCRMCECQAPLKAWNNRRSTRA